MLNEDEPPEGLYNKEEIELKLDKIDIMEKEIAKLKTDVIILNKRINQCWEQVGKNGTKKLRN